VIRPPLSASTAPMSAFEREADITLPARRGCVPSTGAARVELLLNDNPIGIGKPTAIKHASRLGLTQDVAGWGGG